MFTLSATVNRGGGFLELSVITGRCPQVTHLITFSTLNIPLPRQALATESALVIGAAVWDSCWRKQRELLAATVPLHSSCDIMGCMSGLHHPGCWSSPLLVWGERKHLLCSSKRYFSCTHGQLQRPVKQFVRFITKMRLAKKYPQTTYALLLFVSWQTLNSFFFLFSF